MNKLKVSIGTISILICSSLMSISVTAQNTFFQWANAIDKNFGSSGEITSRSLEVDNSGNIFSSGDYQGYSFDFDPGPGVLIINNSNAIVRSGYVRKIDSDGNLLWAYKIGNSNGNSVVNSIKLTNSGDVICTGYFQSTVDFDHGPGVTNLTSTGSSSAFILKINSDGTFNWVKQIISDSGVAGFSIAISSLDEISVVGSFSGQTDFDPSASTFNITSTSVADAFVLKLDPLGNFVWVKSFGPPPSTPNNSIEGYLNHTVDNDGNILITTYFLQSIDFDPGPGIAMETAPAGSSYTAILKLDPNGDFGWVKVIGTYASWSCEVLPTDIGIDDLNNVYIVGMAKGSVDYDPGTNNQNASSSAYHLYILKLDENGDFQWKHRSVSTHDVKGEGLDVLPSGEVFVTGSFLGTTDFDQSTGVMELTTVQGSTVSSDCFTLKIDVNGNLGWVSQIGGSSIQGGTSVKFDTVNNSLLTSGNYTNSGSYSVDFDPGPGTFVLPKDFGAFIQNLGICVSTITSVNVESCGSYTTPSGSHVFTSSGIYSDTLHSMNGCDSILNINLTINPTPNLLITGDTIICLGESTQLTVTGANTYNWSNSLGSSSTVTVSPNFTMSYTVTGTGNNLCTISKQVTIQVNSLDNANFSFGSTSYCPNDTDPTPAITGLSGGLFSSSPAGLSINPSIGQIDISNSIPNTYQVSYLTNGECPNSETITVSIGDFLAPIASVTSLGDINSECPVSALTSPSAIDNCAGSIVGTHNASLPITSQGTTVVTWTYDDGNGNTSTQTQNVVITPIDNGITIVNSVTLSANATGYNYQWVDCDNGNTPIAGATSQSFTPTSAGSYACVIDNGTCSVTTDCLSSTLSIDEDKLERTLVIYPNPVATQLNIQTEDKIISADIIDATGRTISVNFSNNIIDVSNLSNGIYILRIETNKGLNTTKFIKE